MSCKVTNITLVVLLTICSPFANALQGKVVAVHDGDTITILDEQKKSHKIRLAQIDAPELHQPWGKNSKKSLSDSVYLKSVYVEVESIDRYGRQVGTIYLDQEDICRTQVKTGNAWAYRKYLRDPSLLNEEKIAKENKIGLWSLDQPIEPWLWRKK